MMLETELRAVYNRVLKDTNNVTAPGRFYDSSAGFARAT